MSKILNPLQIVASALAMRPSTSDPLSVAGDSDEPPERTPSSPRARRAKRPRVTSEAKPLASSTGR